MLLKLFPDCWDCILVADLLCQSEEWGQLKDSCDDEVPHGYDPAQPWDFVIAAVAYGGPSAPRRRLVA